MRRGSPCVMCVKVTDSRSMSLCLYAPLAPSVHPCTSWRARRPLQMATQMAYCHIPLCLSSSRSLWTLEISQRVGNKAQERAGGGGRNDGSVSITQQTWARILTHPSRRNMKSNRQSAQLYQGKMIQLSFRGGTKAFFKKKYIFSSCCRSLKS